MQSDTYAYVKPGLDLDLDKELLYTKNLLCEVQSTHNRDCSSYYSLLITNTHCVLWSIYLVFGIVVKSGICSIATTTTSTIIMIITNNIIVSSYHCIIVSSLPTTIINANAHMYILILIFIFIYFYPLSRPCLLYSFFFFFFFFGIIFSFFFIVFSLYF